MPISKQQYSMAQAEKQFKETYRELIAFASSGWEDSMAAYVQLNHDEELRNYQPGTNWFRILEEAFLTLTDNATVLAVAELNHLALADLARMRRSTGIGVESLPTPPAPAPTAAQLLEDEVRHDFATLRSDEMRKKRQGNREYEATYQRIASTLGSSTTGLFDATAGCYVGS
jgi:hypothetical protein